MIWEGVLKEKLEALGIAVRVATFTGDSSYPVEYTLSYGDVQAGGEPTLDLAMVAFIGKLLPKEPTLVDCPHCGGAHYPGQVCPLNPMLAELDRLELLSDEASEAMESTNDETEAIAAWRQLKAAQQAGATIKTSLERQGYRVLIDAEKSFRHSITSRKEQS